MERFKRVLAWLAYKMWTLFVCTIIFLGIPAFLGAVSIFAIVFFTPIEDQDTTLQISSVVFVFAAVLLHYAHHKSKFVDRIMDIWKPKK